MALTASDVARHLRYDDEDIVDQDLQSILDSAEQAVKDHVLTKYDAENKIQQRAILMMCGYFDEHRGVSKDTPSNDGFLPQPVKDILMRYYTPLVM
ncbi:phage gp6-like head-tail connector protein [Acinetobacter chinensis]|uniref:Phage gp6-like head-tail connector protein n=2 Tax=Acinetobacter chinensis TaxID=2004650 RepID=A0A3B7LZB0_9GAMM|nr:phage gp6-like head-tail connector protein [Acinetobacter chinensis]